MKYKWTVNKVQVAQDNLVVKVDLTVTGIDGDNSASAAYSRDLVRGDSFVPYEQLTEQQVLDWCFAFENFIKQTLEMTRLPVLTEHEVIKKFGKDITAIDHLIINDDYCIAFQDKWRNSREGNSSINHFIQCVNTVKEISNKPCLAIYLSRLPITKVSQLAFDRQNSNNINYFILIKL